MGNCCCRRGVPSLRCDTVDMFLLNSLGEPDAELVNPGNMSAPSYRTWNIDYAVRADDDCALSVNSNFSLGSIDYDGQDLYINLGTAVVKRSANDLTKVWQIYTDSWEMPVVSRLYCVSGGVVLFAAGKAVKIDPDGGLVWAVDLPVPGGSTFWYSGGHDETIYYWISGAATAQFLDNSTGVAVDISVPSQVQSIYRTINNDIWVGYRWQTIPFIQNSTRRYSNTFTLVDDYGDQRFVFSQDGHINNSNITLTNYYNNPQQGSAYYDHTADTFQTIVTRQSGDPDSTIPVPGIPYTFNRRSNSVYAMDAVNYYGSVADPTGSIVVVLSTADDSAVASGTIRARTAEDNWLPSLRPRRFGNKYLFMCPSGICKARDVNFPE